MGESNYRHSKTPIIDVNSGNRCAVLVHGSDDPAAGSRARPSAYSSRPDHTPRGPVYIHADGRSGERVLNLRRLTSPESAVLSIIIFLPSAWQYILLLSLNSFIKKTYWYF